MPEPAEYQVVMNGGVLDGHDVEEVVAAFSALLKIEATKARHFFAGKRRVVKKRTDLATAEKFCNAFSKIGVDASVVPLVPEPADEFEFRLPEGYESDQDATGQGAPVPAEAPSAAAVEATPAEEPAAEPDSGSPQSPAVAELGLVEEPGLDGERPEPASELGLVEEPGLDGEQTEPASELSLVEEPGLDGERPEPASELGLVEEPGLDGEQTEPASELSLVEEPGLDGEQTEPASELSLVEEPGLDGEPPEPAAELSLVEEPALDAKQAEEPAVPELSLVEEPDLDQEQAADDGAAAPTAAPPAARAARPAAAASGPTMVCPACNTLQPRGEQCPACGAFVAKVKKVESPQDTAAVAEADVPLVETTAESLMPPKAIMAAAAAALLGALLWKGIAIALEMEFALVAWAIGGAVGFASALAGARGSAAGAMCAALALVAIIGGKYMATQSIVDDVFQGEDIWASAEMREAFEKVEADAQAYARVDGTESALRQFMLDHGYTAAFTVEEITDEEIESFLDFNVDVLEWIALTSPDFDEWREYIQSDFIERTEELPIMDIVVESLGLIDLLFLFLGVTTAYRLGVAGKD